MERKPTIFEALSVKLGRTPTHTETCDEVRRILSEVLPRKTCKKTVKQRQYFKKDA